ncbi:MAG TPA: hypothetical protein VI431_12450 [Candidatus Acidoferrum sp.]
MSKVVKCFILFFLTSLCLPTALRAQVINATSCAQSDVQTALNSVTASTATVNIPAGTCQWTTAINYTAPAAVTSLTIRGQTTCTGSGDPANNNLACTDNTIIKDGTAANGDFMLKLSASGFIRLTGITFQSSTTKNDGVVMINGGTGANEIRIDHNRFNSDTGGTASAMLDVSGCSYGVADHNIFQNLTGTTGFGIVPYNGVNCNGNEGSNQDGAWAVPTGFGGANFLVVEQNLFQNNTAGIGSNQAVDCDFGGKAVYRFNTFFNGAHLQTHPTGSGVQLRGCRATEIYKNQWIVTIPFTTAFSNTNFFFSSGPALIWGNNPVGQGYASWVQLTDCRSPSGSSRCGYSPPTPPNGFGFCGSGSGWDGNTNASGYPCIDQPTRGQGDLLTGSFPTKCDQTTGCSTFNGTWPHQKLEPLYFWLNQFQPLGGGNDNGLIVLNGSIWTQNQDYYVSSDPNSPTDCTGFTGATGVGCGARSARPATCTSGVAYFSTDQGSWNTSGNGAGNGVLDICSSTNTWTNAFYTPYAYPHPLTLGSGTPPAAPTNLKAVVN